MIDWLNTHDKKKIAKVFWNNLSGYIFETVEDREAILHKACTIHLLRCSGFKTELIEHSGTIKALMIIICFEQSNSFKKLLTSVTKKLLASPKFEFDEQTLAFMLAELTKNGFNLRILSLLLKNPKLDINKGLKRLTSQDNIIGTDLIGFELSDDVDTPLMQAVRQNNKDVVHLILMHPKIDVFKTINKSASDVAKEIRDHEELLPWDREIHIFETDNGKTALDFAKKRGNQEIIEALELAESRAKNELTTKK